MKDLTKDQMLSAFKELNKILPRKVSLIIGGGGSMILAHGFKLSTYDIDGYPKGMEISELSGFVKKVAKKLKLPADWLNPWFSSFTHVLPSDFSDRLISVFNEKKLGVSALGKEDLLIMKCFAHRQKDISHAKALIKGGANIKFVEDHIELLKNKNMPGTSEALDFLDDILEQM